MAVATEREYGLFINGELVEPASGDVRDLTEPATGEPLGRAAMGGGADIDRAVEAARAALDGPWGRTPPTERSRLLHALADAIVANRKELAELEVRNVGKAISSVKAEVSQAVENFRFYASAIASIAGRSNPIGGSHRIAARIKSGTVGINMPYTAFPGIPFVGYKQSGFGRELALETLDLYLETKSVVVSTGARPINPFGL